MPWGNAARSTGLYDVVEPLYARWQRSRWESAGHPIPAPSAVKRDILRQYGRGFGLRTLVETGTYKGDTVRALRYDFESIHSIEIDHDLYAAAVRRCRTQSNATLHHGDSGVLLADVVAGLEKEAALFWLDAHHSGGATGGGAEPPLLAELDTILIGSTPHVVLVDDVREFGSGGDVDYPELELIRERADRASYRLEVRDDIARLTPGSELDD